MKLPRGALRTLLCLPDNFTGSVTINLNGHGVCVVEVRHQQRFSPEPEELIDLADVPLLHGVRSRRRGHSSE